MRLDAGGGAGRGGGDGVEDGFNERQQVAQAGRGDDDDGGDAEVLLVRDALVGVSSTSKPLSWASWSRSPFCTPFQPR